MLGHLLDLIGDPAAWLNLCHLAAFFCVSGYLLCSSLQRHTLSAVLDAKVRGLLVPYLIWSSVSLAANLCLSWLRTHTQTLENAASEFTEIFLRARSVWFLLHLFLACGLLLLCRRLTRTDVSFWGMNLALYAALCLILPTQWFQFALFKRLYPFFLAGYAVGSVSELRDRFWRLAQIPGAKMLIWGYPVFVWLFVRSGLYAEMAHSPKAAVLGLLVGADGVALLFCAAKWVSSGALGCCLAELGQYSIDLYVIHMFLVKFLPVQVLLEGRIWAWQYLLLTLYGGVIVAVIWLLAKCVLRRSRLYCLSVGRNWYPE